MPVRTRVATPRRGRLALAGNSRLSICLAAVALLLGAPAAHASAAADPPVVADGLAERAQREGSVRVIAGVRLPSGAPRAEGALSAAAVRTQRAEIAAAQSALLQRLGGAGWRLARQFRTVPFVALEVGPGALAALGADPGVLRVVEDRLVAPVLGQSAPLIQADLAWDFGYDGTGQVIAVLDTGVESAHPFLAGKVVSEACYASGNDCPNGQSTQVGPGAGEPCPFAPLACQHGTHVAGIAAGSGSAFSGVARSAELIAIQVFHSSTSDCIPFLEENPCARAFSSDIGAGLERVYELRDTLAIAAVNLSLGGGAFTSHCDFEEPQLTAQINNLRSVGIATVVASGNSGSTNTIAFPACISSAVSVGATTKFDQVAWFSDVAPILDLLAPGAEITSSVPGGSFDVFDGTSMAAPHVAGAWALMRQRFRTSDVGTLLANLRTTGLPITDDRDPAGVTTPRIQVVGALNIELPVPVMGAIAPATVNAWGPGFELTVTGSDFVRSSVVRFNGANRPTTFVDSTTLRAAIPASDIATTAAGASITVFTHGPAGGTSAPATLALRQPVLTVSAASVTAGGSVTVTLTNPPGGATDWITLAASGSPDTSYAQWTYVGTASPRTWTVTIGAAGSYEFRLLLNGGYQRAAVSPTVTVAPAPPPVLAVSASSVPAGGQVTVTLTNGPGGGADWLALATVGSANTTYLQWTYVGAGVTTRTWTVTLGAPGSYEFRLFLNGGYTRAATSPAVSATAATPVLTVDTTTVQAGGQVTVTLTGGAGGAQDWLALARVGTPDTSYVQSVYVGAGVSSRTWTVSLASSGSYEFRLFLNNGYVRAATSPTVTVSAPPGGTPTLSVSATTVTAGASVTATLANAPGGAQDRLVLAAVGSPDSVFLQSTLVGAGVTTRTWTVVMDTAGAFEFRLLLGNGTRAATSPAVTVTAPPGGTPPTLTVSSTSVVAGAPVTVSLANGGGGALDWISFAVVGSPNTSYVQWTYVGGGVTTRTWTVTPSAAGSYEFRYFPNGGSVRTATSPAVSVAAAAPPSLTVSATSVTAGGQVTVTLANAPGGGADWLALAVVGSPNTSYLQWTYVGAGVTTRTWTVTLGSAGSYEFRFFPNGGYVRTATSPTVTVSP
jgi:subtilisin family serine protease